MGLWPEGSADHRDGDSPRVSVSWRPGPGHVPATEAPLRHGPRLAPPGSASCSVRALGMSPPCGTSIDLEALGDLLEVARFRCRRKKLTPSHPREFLRKRGGSGFQPRLRDRRGRQRQQGEDAPSASHGKASSRTSHAPAAGDTNQRGVDLPQARHSPRVDRPSIAIRRSPTRNSDEGVEDMMRIETRVTRSFGFELWGACPRPTRPRQVASPTDARR